MNEEQVFHAMSIDDAYKVERVLASSNLGITECVTFDGVGPFVRKKIPLSLANRKVWAALAECSSPRLPQIAVTYEMPDQFIVVYDYIPGDTLEQVVAGNGRLSVVDTISIVKDIAEALSDLHLHGIVHCDLAPNNIIIAADGAHIIDFGIAQQIGACEDDVAKTASLGTWGFAAPEQYGFAAADQRSDIYSLARLIGYMLCGVLPDKDDYKQVLSLLSDIPEGLVELIKKGTSFEPSARFQSCRELIDAINQIESFSSCDSTCSSGAVYAFSFSDVSSGNTNNEVTNNSQKVSTATLDTTKNTKRIIMLICGTCAAFLLVLVGVIFAFSVFSILFQDNSIKENNSVASSDASDDSFSEDQGELSAGVMSASSLDSVVSINDSGWSVDRFGMVCFGIELINNDSSHGVMSPAFSIVGRSSDGSILFSEEQALMYLQPGETIHYGSFAGGGSAVPATVEFKPIYPSLYDLVSDTSANNAVFQIDNVSVFSAHDETKFTGEVFLDHGEYPDQSITGVLVTVILRDESGEIVYGNSIDAEKPTESAATTFELSCFDVPDYASYELYACVW